MSDKIKLTIYTHLNTGSFGDPLSHYTFDLSSQGYPLLGTCEVEIDPPTKDPVIAETEMLNDKLEDLENKHYDAIQKIKTRLTELACIEHKPETV